MSKRITLSLAFILIVLAPGALAGMNDEEGVRIEQGGGLSSDSVSTRTDANRKESASRADTLHGKHAAEENADEESDTQPAYVLKPWRELRTHLHNKLIHVPIGFSLAAFFLTLVALRWSDVEPAIRWVVLIAALGALAAVVAGLGQAAAFEGSSKEWVIGTHKVLGIATAISLWLWAAAWWVRPLRRWTFVFGCLAALLITVTGFFGGVVAHG